MTAYRPQQHAAAVADWTEVSQRLLREVAALRGDVALLVNIHRKGQQAEAALDRLVETICNAMPVDQVWYTHEILARAVRADDSGQALVRAITEAGAKLKTKSLGIYLSRRVKSGRYVTESGYCLERSGSDSIGVLWCAKRV